jgi:hypothetical protein
LIAKKKRGGTFLHIFLFLFYKTQQKTKPTPGGNWLRRMSFENWERYRRKRYRIEGVFGSMKLKVGSSFTLIREDLAKKTAIACAILWNLYMIIPQTLWFFVIVLRVVRKDKRSYNIFLNSP